MKRKLFLFLLAVLLVKTCLGQVENAAVVANNSGVFTSAYHVDLEVYYEDPFSNGQGESWYDALNWHDGAGGQEGEFDYSDLDINAPRWAAKTWPTNSWPQPLPGGVWVETEWTNAPFTNVIGYVTLPSEHCDTSGYVAYQTKLERRSADTEVKLATGGPAGSTRQNLWVLTATANDEVTGAAIPSGQISMGSYGNLGTDGNLYVLLPDNDLTPITPKVEGNDHYNFTAGGDKYPLAIVANDSITLSNDVVASGANFCVGQNISFALSGVPSGVVATNFQWTLGGIYFNAQSNAVPGGTFPNSSGVPYVDSSLLKTNVTTAWWVSGGINNDANTPAVYTVSLTCELIFTNGNPSQPYATSGLFNMFRPHAVITTHTGIISLDSNYFLITNNVPAGNVFALHYGFPSFPPGTYSTNGLPGIEFTNSTTRPTNFPGSVEWVQVVNSALHKKQLAGTGSWLTTVQITNAMLDTSFPYDTADRTEDSPGEVADPPILYQGISCSDSFSMWLLFAPNSGTHLVPLCKVDWSWSATADSITGLTSTNNTINPTGDSTVYPYWIDNATNHENLY